jgi:cytidylate kinase
MAIITISRGCFSHGREIAERVAAALGYECISQEVLLEASESFNIPEKKLAETLHGAPGLIERITHARRHFLDFIRTALMEHAKKDNIVYHGYAGHILLPGISHVLKIRVMADMEDRVTFLQRQKKVSRDVALHLIEQEDNERAEWYHYIYKKDMSNPQFYDMVLHIGRLRIQDACDVICTAAKSDTFKATTVSRTALYDLALCSHVSAVINGICSADEVTCRDGSVHIKVKGQKIKITDFTSPEMQQQIQTQIRNDLYREITSAVKKIPDVKEIICDIEVPYYV